MKFSLVIPMYNESAIIENTLTQANDSLRECFIGASYEIIAVNDGSTDDTAEKVKHFIKTHPDVRLEGYADNRGKGSAVRCGMLAAKGDIIAFTDADLAYGTDVLKEFADKAAAGADIVLGSRAIAKDGYKGYTPLRKFMSKAYLKLIQTAAGFKHTDSQTGIKCFSKHAAKEIFSKCEVNGFAFDLEALFIAEKLGYKITELPVVIINHRESKVKPIRDAIKMLNDVKRIKQRLKKKNNIIKSAL